MDFFHYQRVFRKRQVCEDITHHGNLALKQPIVFSSYDFAASMIQVGKQLVEYYTNGETPVRLMCNIKSY